LGTQSRDYNNDVAEGSIFFQDPSGGENVEPGTAVDVAISLGPEQVEVPEVYGLSVAAAQTALSNAGLNSTPIEVEGDEPAGTALATDPGAGAMLDPGSTVSLFYSAGPPPATTASPNSGPSQGPDRKAQDEKNTDAKPADQRPADRPQRNNRPQNNSGPGNGGQDNSGQGSSGSGNGVGLGTNEPQGSGS
jgi:serine/threonine-protein kinase